MKAAASGTATVKVLLELLEPELFVTVKVTVFDPAAV